MRNTIRAANRMASQIHAKKKHPETPATRLLKQHKINFEVFLYTYQPHGGSRLAAQALGVAEHTVVKTLVMENEHGKPLLVLMHGDEEVATKRLATAAGCKAIHPCAPETATKHTGYQLGGTSPFGTRKRMPVFVEASILELTRILINGGKRGFLLELDPRHIVEILDAAGVSVGR